MLWENLPYTNYENINLDMIIEDMKIIIQHVQEIETHLEQLDEIVADHGRRITIIEGNITEINEILENLNIEEIVQQITEINEQITHIEEIIGDLDIDAIIQMINTYNSQSIARDEDLSRRISLLEQQIINPIDVYTGTENLILWGSDFRQLPSSAKDENGYPIGAPCGNAEYTSNPNCCISFDDYGFTANPNGTGYTNLTLGRFNDIQGSSTSLALPITVTLGIVSGATPSMTSAVTEIVKTFTERNQNLSLQEELGQSINLHLDYNTNTTYLTLDIRGQATPMKTAFTNKHLVYARVEYGAGSAGVRFNNHDSKIASLIAQASGALTPSEVEAIVHDNLADIVGEVAYDHAYDVTLVPADGSGAYSIDAELDLRLTWKLGFLSGILAINIPMDATEMDIDLSKSFDMVVDISALNAPPKTIRADTIHFYSDLFSGAQFDVVLNSSLSKLNSMRVWGAMRPIHLTGSIGDKKTIAVIKIFEPSVWTQPTPDNT